MRPQWFFLLAVISGAGVLLSAATAAPGTCAQGSSSGPTALTAVFLILGLLSILAIFAGIIAWGRQQEPLRGQRAVTWIVRAAVGAGVWGAVGFVVLVAIALDKSGCLS